MGEMRIADSKEGDLKVIWNPEKKEEVKAAKEQFDKLKSKGYLAYTVKKNGKAGEVLHEFDEDAEMMILSPAIQGG